MTSEPRPTSNASSLILAVVLTLIGVVETFVRPEPGELFGPAMLIFGPAMGLFWWSGRTGNRTLRTVANAIGGVAVALALFDIVRDWL